MMLMTTISCTTVEGMGRGKLYNYLYFFHTTYRSAIVYLHCNETATDPIITTLGDSEQQFLYIFDLYTNLVCLKSQNEHNSSASGYIGFILIFL